MTRRVLVLLLLFAACTDPGPIRDVVTSASPGVPTVPPIPRSEPIRRSSMIGCQPKLTEYKTGIAKSEPTALASGPDDAIWFADPSAGAIGRLSISSGKVWSFRPSPRAEPTGIAAGPDGAMWFTDSGRSLIGRLTLQGKLTEYRLPPDADTKLWEPDGEANPTTIVPGTDGAMWFVESGADKLGRITMDGRITEYDVPDDETLHSNPTDLAQGGDGKFWVTRPLADAVGRFDPASDVWSEMRLPDEGNDGVAHAESIEVIGAEAWFTQAERNAVGRARLDGSVDYVHLPTPGADPAGITVGAEGNLWVAEAGGNRLASITPGGVVTEYGTLPDKKALPGTVSNGIIKGPDDVIWFSEARGKVARFGC